MTPGGKSAKLLSSDRVESHGSAAFLSVIRLACSGRFHLAILEPAGLRRWLA